MLLYCKNIEALIQDDITRNPPRMHALKGLKCVTAYLGESQPLVWTSLLDTTRLSEMHLYMKLARRGS
jgi:hypothetical protein